MIPDDTVWKKRFALFALLRVSGIALFFLGMTIAFSALLRPGGHLPLGLFVIGLGLCDALLGPVLLRQHWERTDQR